MKITKNVTFFTKLVFKKVKIALPYIIILAITVTIGKYIGEYLANHSQTSRIYKVQTNLVNSLLNSNFNINNDTSHKQAKDLIINAKDPELCRQTLHNELDDTIISLENSENKCNGTISELVTTPADIIERYTEILKIACQ